MSATRDAESWFYEHYRDVSAVGIALREKLHDEKSAYQRIEVYDTVGHGRLLTLDGMVMVSELDEFVYHELLVHVPLCAHPAPSNVLVIGGGDGGSVREVLRHPQVQRVVQCEIDERVTRVSERFFPTVAGRLDDPRVELAFEDGVQYVARHPSAFDVIIVDGSEPIGPAKALFDEPFFRSLAGALKPGGRVSAQAESPWYAPKVVAELFGGMRRVFDDVHAYAGVIPTYPGGLWTFCLAGQDLNPAQIDAERLASLETRWLDEDNLASAFALPAFVRALVHSRE